MRIIEHAGLRFTVDDEGYLVNTDDWNETAAAALAKNEGIDQLTADRMDIIRFMREHYKKYNFFPLLGAVCKNVHLAKDCFSESFIDPLTAWKIAGLPRPDEHVIGYLRGEGGVV